MSRRILFLTEGLYPLGNSQSLKGLCRALAAKQADVHVATCATDTQREWGDEMDGVTLHHLGRKSNRDWGCWWRLRQLIKNLSPDCVHVWGAASVPLGLASQQGSNCRTVVSMLEIPRSRSLLYRWLAGQKLRKNRIVVCHPVIAEHLIRDDYLPSSESVTVIPNAIETIDCFQSDKARLLDRLGLADSQTVIVGASAELTPRTRLKDLVWACGLLQIAKYNVHLYLVGSGSQERRLRRYVRMTNASEYVHFGTDRVRDGELFGGIDVYWHSHLVRPLPSEMMSAMELGIPVISVIGSGTEELVIHQSTAFATNIGARDEFARWTKYIIEQREQANQLTEQANQYVRQKYPLSDLTDQYVRLYD